MEKETCLVILIAPCWESHPCFPVLLSLLVAPAIKLPCRQDLLIQPHSCLTHLKPEIFNLHAWLCCREVSRRQDFLKDLPRESVLLKELPHSLSAGLGGSVGCAVRLETRRSRVHPPPRSATFFHGDWSWNIFYGHSLPSADSRRAVVSFWRKNVHNTG